jgi:hypothetical protein
MDPNLSTFIQHARERGLDYATIRSLLIDAGWKDKVVGRALAEQMLDVPVPRPAGGGSAKDTFFHLLAFTALYTWVISLIALLFTCINVTWPDPAWPVYAYSHEYVSSSIRWALAAIVVAYPVFLLLWRGLLRAFARDPERRQSRVHRWLTYLSLFCAAVTILTDLITLVYYAFDGELTTRFSLKVLVLFVVAGATFLYLALTLRGGKEAAS